MDRYGRGLQPSRAEINSGALNPEPIRDRCGYPGAEVWEVPLRQSPEPDQADGDIKEAERQVAQQEALVHRMIVQGTPHRPMKTVSAS